MDGGGWVSQRTLSAASLTTSSLDLASGSICELSIRERIRLVALSKFRQEKTLHLPLALPPENTDRFFNYALLTVVSVCIVKLVL